MPVSKKATRQIQIHCMINYQHSLYMFCSGVDMKRVCTDGRTPFLPYAYSAQIFAGGMHVLLNAIITCYNAHVDMCKWRMQGSSRKLGIIFCTLPEFRLNFVLSPYKHSKSPVKCAPFQLLYVLLNYE